MAENRPWHGAWGRCHRPCLRWRHPAPNPRRPPIAADLATLIRGALDLLARPELHPRELDPYATSTVDVAGRPSVCLVSASAPGGPVVVWSAMGAYEEWMAAGLAGPYLALHLEPDSGYFHLGQPALVRERGHLRLVAELVPEALASERELAAALEVFLDRQCRAHELLRALG
ncbi:hypothetical protein ACWCYY_24160 [Kitasatospora sp. NPDC001664]